jgi:hypothetical protein
MVVNWRIGIERLGTPYQRPIYDLGPAAMRVSFASILRGASAPALRRRFAVPADRVTLAAAGAWSLGRDLSMTYRVRAIGDGGCQSLRPTPRAAAHRHDWHHAETVTSQMPRSSIARGCARKSAARRYPLQTPC